MLTDFVNLTRGRVIWKEEPQLRNYSFQTAFVKIHGVVFLIDD